MTAVPGPTAWMTPSLTVATSSRSLDQIRLLSGAFSGSTCGVKVRLSPTARLPAVSVSTTPLTVMG